ncbi:MAG: phosphatase PAP2 family protein [Sphingobium sp.]
MRAYWPPTGARFISEAKARWRGGGAFALALLCVLFIALARRAGWLEGLDHGLMRAAGVARDTVWGGHVTPMMRLATMLGDTIARFTLLGGALLFLLWRRRTGMTLWLAAMMAGGTLLNLGLKQLFAAPRPDLLQHLDVVTTYSFPSGHAAGNMMFFGALALLAGRRDAFAVAAFVIALIGVSRVWLGVHWPSDVAAGWIEGLGWLALWRALLPARGRQQ